MKRGGIGESCRARNDCASGLACIRDTCVPDNSALRVTGKSCFRVECGEATDCCGTFVPDPSCADYQAACEANPDDCLAFRQLCECHRECTEARCVDTSPECLIDSHCPWFDRSLCVDERCVECRVNTDCADTTDACVDGACTAACTADAQCPLLNTCVEGACIPTGCTSDRECAFVLGTANATCRDSKCEVSCSSNTDCDLDRFEACDDGRCVFVGCSTDAECRAYLDLANEPGDVSAECR